jgi:phosphoglycerate-specific signal transduction histidine kinase
MEGERVMDDNAGKLPLLFKCFRDSLIGKNTRGIIHNINSPLQVLSMQIELLRMDLFKLRKNIFEPGNAGFAEKEAGKEFLDIMDKCFDRVGQIEEVVQRINGMIGVIAARVNETDDDSHSTPVMLAQLLEEQAEFWKSDLFFKHKVSLGMNLPKISPVVVVREDVLRDTIDGIMFGCLEQVRMEAEPEIGIDLIAGSGEQEKPEIVFSQNGPVFPVEDIMQLIERFSQKGIDDFSAFENIPPGHFSLLLASTCAGVIGFHIEILPNGIVVRGRNPERQ